MAQAPCPACGCAHLSPVHAVVAALQAGDLGAALDAGLLDPVPCPGCAPDCNARVADARAGRLAAFAARKRYRARQDRLARRQRERDARRAAPPAAPVADARGGAALPPAAAAALARAKARAARKP